MPDVWIYKFYKNSIWGMLFNVRQVFGLTDF